MTKSGVGTQKPMPPLPPASSFQQQQQQQQHHHQHQYENYHKDHQNNHHSHPSSTSSSSTTNASSTNTPSATSIANAEIPIWIGDRKKWVTGISRKTTINDLIYAILKQCHLISSPDKNSTATESELTALHKAQFDKISNTYVLAEIELLLSSPQPQTIESQQQQPKHNQRILSGEAKVYKHLTKWTNSLLIPSSTAASSPQPQSTPINNLTLRILQRQYINNDLVSNTQQVTSTFPSSRSFSNSHELNSRTAEATTDPSNKTNFTPTTTTTTTTTSTNNSTQHHRSSTTALTKPTGFKKLFKKFAPSATNINGSTPSLNANNNIKGTMSNSISTSNINASSSTKGKITVIFYDSLRKYPKTKYTKIPFKIFSYFFQQNTLNKINKN
jgi:hypothetical protein